MGASRPRSPAAAGGGMMGSSEGGGEDQVVGESSEETRESPDQSFSRGGGQFACGKAFRL